VCHFVSDRGVQFTGQSSREALAQLGIRQRFGAIGKTGSIALIARFWRTVKDGVGLRFWCPLLSGFWTPVSRRPHQGLGGGAPAEVYFGISRTGTQRPEGGLTRSTNGRLPIRRWSNGAPDLIGPTRRARAARATLGHVAASAKGACRDREGETNVRAAGP